MVSILALQVITLHAEMPLPLLATLVSQLEQMICVRSPNGHRNFPRSPLQEARLLSQIATQTGSDNFPDVRHIRKGGSHEFTKMDGHYTQSLSCLVALAIALTIIAATANGQENTIHRGISKRRIDVGPLNAASRMRSKSANVQLTIGPNDVRYRTVPIGVLPGKTNSDITEEVNVINNLGHVAGFSFVNTGDIRDYFLTAQAFVWQNAKLQALPLLQGWPGAFATGINDRDQVIGEANNFDSSGRRLRTAIFWDEGKAIDLGTLDSNSNSAAFGINNWGTAVGFNHSLADGHNTPVVWYGGKIHALPLLPGETNALAFGINDFGVISGFQYVNQDIGEVACLWYWNGSRYTVVGLGSLGGNYSEAFGVNNWGQAVGDSSNAGDLNSLAALWDWRGPHTLPLLPGDTDGFANPINDLGQVLGLSFGVDENGDDTQRVVLWQNGRVIDLRGSDPFRRYYDESGNLTRRLFHEVDSGTLSNPINHKAVSFSARGKTRHDLSTPGDINSGTSVLTGEFRVYPVQGGTVLIEVGRTVNLADGTFVRESGPHPFQDYSVFGDTAAVQPLCDALQ